MQQGATGGRGVVLEVRLSDGPLLHEGMPEGTLAGTPYVAVRTPTLGPPVQGDEDVRVTRTSGLGDTSCGADARVENSHGICEHTGTHGSGYTGSQWVPGLGRTTFGAFGVAVGLVYGYDRHGFPEPRGGTSASEPGQ